MKTMFNNEIINLTLTANRLILKIVQNWRISWRIEIEMPEIEDNLKVKHNTTIVNNFVSYCT